MVQQSLLENLDKAGWSAKEKGDRIALFCIDPERARIPSKQFKELMEQLKNR